MFSLESWELHNAVRSERGLCVRDGFRRLVQATTIAAGSEICAVFSVESANTSEVSHYLFLRDVDTGVGTLYVTTEEFRTVTTLSLGKLPERPVVTWAVQNQQILINSPHFSSPLYGWLGGAIVLAEKVDSVYTGSTAIDIPTGICCSFGNRVAVASNGVVYFNDPGLEIRTFVAENAVNFETGTIYDMLQGPSGALHIIGSRRIMLIAPDAISGGQEVFGATQSLDGYQASNYRNTAMGAGQVVGLGRAGLVNISGGMSNLPLTSFQMKRRLSSPVGPGPSGDYRSGSLWGSDRGVLVNLDGKLCMVDLTGGQMSWIYKGSDIEVVGTLRSRDGEDLLVFPDGVYQMFGNTDWDDEEISGVACGGLQVDPAQSTVVHSVTTVSDNHGMEQRVYVLGNNKAKTTGVPSGFNNVIGTSTWDSTEIYRSRELRSARHIVKARTDDLQMEIGVEGSRRSIQVASVQTGGQDGARP